ncbi:MerR family transcriptional regulator [Steroidobacter agaridevorans]|uniref:MerR family transcriptional regulator n=1 Tax=Steroidobacter agaridevorans TaxID=2695856 RepID=A0A829Y5Y0_9GAMM|nr:helix-turn-helix domain-containing protein [Steroidobacter agaridevorans]GFE78634.1 MerR family transcriptional regulator [Steroidobacter agaridevorans]
MLRIGEFARLANVSIKLVRHYDEIGLLPAHAIDPNTNYRYYSVTQLARINELLVYRSLGFSLQEVRRLLRAEHSPEQLREMLLQRRASLQVRIEAERARLEEVEARISQIEREGSLRPYETTIRSLDAGFAVSLRRTCDSYDEIGDMLQALRAKLPAKSAVMGQGAIWHRCLGTSSSIDCEALLFVDPDRSLHCDGLTLVKVPACTVASVMLDDTVENPRSAYRAAVDRASRLGYRIAGPMRERYSSQAEPGGSIEVQFPLAPASRRPSWSHL